jgi:hypothetical protein
MQGQAAQYGVVVEVDSRFLLDCVAISQAKTFERARYSIESSIEVMFY